MQYTDRHTKGGIRDYIYGKHECVRVELSHTGMNSLREVCGHALNRYSMELMMQGVIFDLNGVFIKSPKLSDRFQDDFGVAPKAFLPALKEVMEKVRMPGAGRAFGYWEPFLKAWGVGFDEKTFFDYWFNAEKEVPEMVALALELKERGVKIFILSNNFSERAAYYEKSFPFLKNISDKIYYSWQTGYVKPNRLAYTLILEENKIKPSDARYFDDAEENIKVAQELGIQSYLFKDVADTRSKLE